MELEKLKRRGAVVLPSLFTVGNMAFGFFAVLAAQGGEYARGAWLILSGMIFDALDGRIARLVHGESAFGIEFDSLADFLAFCVAPALLLYHFILHEYGFWGAPVAFFFALCGGLRLARFNIVSHAGGGSKTHFTGLPTPAAAGILSSFVLVYDMLESGSSARGLRIIMQELPLLYIMIPFIVLGLSLLMISELPYRAFKQPELFRPRSIKNLLLIVAAAFLAYAYPQNAIFIFFSFYVLSGLVAGLVGGARRLARTGERADDASAALPPHDRRNN